MKPVVSIVIPYYNDPDVTIDTLECLYDTIDIDRFEVVLIDDGSKDKVPKDYQKPNLVKYRHFTNLGVGHAFDTGASISRSDNLFLMGSDIRFDKNGWATRMLSVMEKHPKALICTACKSNATDKTYYGADIIFFSDASHLGDGHPRKSIEGYRSILEGKWRPRTGRGVYPVPSLMGAFYGVQKAWYEKINGFELHYQWGGLEPLISLKSWRYGGEVLVDSTNYNYHLFGRGPRREPKWDVVKYNQLMIAGTVFGSFGKKYAKYMETERSKAWDAGCEMYMDKINSVMWFAQLFADEAVLTPQELEDKVVELSYYYNLEDCPYPKP